MKKISQLGICEAGKSRTGLLWKQGDRKQRLETLEVQGRREIRLKRRTESIETEKGILTCDHRHKLKADITKPHHLVLACLRLPTLSRFCFSLKAKQGKKENNAT